VVVGLIASVTVLAAATGAGGYAVSDAARGTPSAGPVAPTPSALRAAGAAPSAAPETAPGTAASATGVARALAPLLHAAGLGPRVRAEIVDVADGTTLLASGADAPTAPASTAKLLTAAAVLSVHPAGYRITTTVRRGTGGAVVLVGAGDPTLTGAAAGRSGAYPEAARVSDLAAQLRRAGVTPTGIVVDDSLFAGPGVSPQWAPEDVPSDYASPITALMVDGGRDRPADYIRSSAPDLAAGHRLATALGRPSLPVVRGRAGRGAAVLASVRSASLSTLVAQMLDESDNVIAECLARQVAIAEHRPPSFTGAAQAVRSVLARLGVDPGARLVDGSGLAASDRVSAATLAGVLRLAAGTARLRYLVAGLPVAAWSGTLADRYLTGDARAGAGVVRAKTGTLTGVSALAGLVHDRGGRLLAFALVADRAPSTPAAEAALDAVAGRLARCGCG
jgi:D-alanyl-D-alanine carboxypeptidase/D-alanyl-D-alanine-endopeptidase (penicillin-binding protein 4)